MMDPMRNVPVGEFGQEGLLRVVVAGAGGQLGRMLAHCLAEQGGVWDGGCTVGLGAAWYFLDRQQLDITDRGHTREILGRINPDLVVNCAAYTKVDRAEEEPDRAMAVNAEGVRSLLDSTESLGRSGSGSHIVHISTDYVFGGYGNIPYTEESVPRPQCAYAHSKRSGELALLGNRRAMVLRTGWLYSHFEGNFFTTMLNRCLSGEPLRVVYDQVGCPTWAGSLAKIILHIVGERRLWGGLYHCTDLGVASWYDFAVSIHRMSQCNNSIQPIRSNEYAQLALRPSYSVLDGSWSRQALGYASVHWASAMQDCFRLWQGRVRHNLPAAGLITGRSAHGVE